MPVEEQTRWAPQTGWTLCKKKNKKKERERERRGRERERVKSKKKNSCPSRESNHNFSVVQHVASVNIDYTIPASVCTRSVRDKFNSCFCTCED